jgi:WD40 repeat protein
MPRLIAVRLLGAVVVTLLVAGCGGGGGGGGGGVSALKVNSNALPEATVGVAYPGFQFTASGGVPPVTWSATGLPPGLSLSTSGALSGTPFDRGTYSFTVTAVDSSDPAQINPLTVTLVIKVSTIVVGTTPAPPDGSVTHPYASYSFTVASGGLGPFTWQVTAGRLPPGMTLGNDGSLAGAPTAAGIFLFTVTATDSDQPPGTGSHAFTVTVNTPGPPFINPAPAPPEGILGSPYGYTFTATGGYLPLSWAVTAGKLPPGLMLTTAGGIAGTPTTLGTFPFTVTVTDSEPTPKMNSLAFPITITPPPPPTINDTPPPTGTVGTAYAFTFTASNGLAPLVWSETGPLPAGLTLSAGGVLSGTPQADGQFPITLYVTDAMNRSAPGVLFTVRVSLARAAAGFTQTKGSMTIARFGHSATLLLDGKVLIAGGPNATAELYDPTSETFGATGSMTVARSGHTATLLADKALPNYGDVLVAAGGSQTAELYDPTTGMFTATGSMVVAHDVPTATLLQNGQVLIAGGETASAELYNPASGKFTATGSMTVSRTFHTATLLQNGEVLIAGGYTTTGTTATAELYDPTSGKFMATGSMNEPRAGHTATLLMNGPALTNGSVLIAGRDLTAEVYDPASGAFSLVGNLLTAVSGSTASLRSDGTVVFAGGSFEREYVLCGGYRGGCSRLFAPVSTSSAELFAPESEGFTGTGSLVTARDGHTATVLADGSTILVAGGLHHVVAGYPEARASATPLASAELYK